MQIDAPYGSRSLPLDLGGLALYRLAPSTPIAEAGVASLVAGAVDAPVSGPSLAARARGARTATVVVPDATRPVDLPEVLPIVLERILGSGLAPERVTVLVACGTHPPVPEVQILRRVGPLPAGVTVRQHDSHDAGTMRRVTALADGTPVRLAREVLDADLVVTVASVQHHYFAGFGGGPKMIFPGVAGYEEIQRNHSRVIRLDATPAVRDDRCEPGALEGNPVAEEIRHVAHRCPPSMEICMVAGRGGVSWAAAGDFGAPFAAAVARAREWFEVKPVRLARGVASAGGAPVDQTVIQAHKALDAACRFLVDGGELLYLARMELGGGSPAVEPFLRDPDPDRIVEALAQEYVQYGHTTLRLLEKTRRFRVRLVSDLDPDLARRLGFEPVSEPQPVLAQWRRESRGPVGVMTERPVYPRTAAIVEPD